MDRFAKWPEVHHLLEISVQEVDYEFYQTGYHGSELQLQRQIESSYLKSLTN